MCSIDVRETADPDVIAPLLERDRVWSVYGLCDLEEPYSRHTRFYCAMRRQEAQAVVMVYAPPTFTGLQGFGPAGMLAELLQGARSLPERMFYQFREEDMDALRLRYAVDSKIPMYRMVVRADELQPARPVEAEIRRLTPSDSEAAVALYRQWKGAVFDPASLETSVAFGAFVNGELAAAAGTHCYSVARRLAAIGAVFTAPQHRGKGLATAVTGAVAETVAGMGIDTIALNVHRENAPAIAAYRRLGFRVYGSLLEGNAHLHLRP